jgi:predicted RNA-binding protein (virulence factor B family)
MIEVGKYYTLVVKKEVDFGIYLDAALFADGGAYSEILLPKREVPKGVKPGDAIEVFLYKDSQGRPIATTKKPKIQLGEFACLEVMDVNKYGAFLDWGVENQLLLPFSEQPIEVKTGDKIVVYLYLDTISDRLVATARTEQHLEKLVLPDDRQVIKEGAPVKLMPYEKTDLGYKAILTSDETTRKYIGMIYQNDIFKNFSVGETLDGFVKTVREDKKIDVTLRQIGVDERLACKNSIIDALRENGAFLPLNDDSTPEEIQRKLEMSKKSFKRAVGMLLKESRIEFTNDPAPGIRLKP